MEQKRIHRSHRTHRRSSRSTKTGFDRFLSSPLFIALGSIFLLIGVYSSLSASKGSNGFYDALMSYFAPAVDGPVGPEIAGTGLTELLLYFLPPIVILTGCLIFWRNFRAITLPASVLAAIFLIVIQVKISFVNPITGGCFYPDFLTAILFLGVSTLLLLGAAYRHRNSSLLILSCFFFYISALLLATIYITRWEYLLTFIVLFTLMVAVIGQKIEKPVIHVINGVFAWGFLGLIWLRELVVNARQEFLTLFFTFAILFYLLLYGIVLFSSSKKGNPLPKWIGLVITGSNLLVLLGTFFYIFNHYYSPLSMGIFVTGLLLFHLIVLYGLNKYNYSGWKLPHYYITILLASLMLPLLLLHYRILIFTALLSVFMLWHSTKFKEKSALLISLSALLVMAAYYLFTWISSFIPALFSTLNLPDQELLVYGFIMGMIVVGALWLTTSLIQKGELPSHLKWFKKQKYDRGVRIALHIAIFLTMGWLSFMTVCLSTASLDYSSAAWFFSGVLFFVGAITYYKGRQSILKQPILYAALAFILLYPFVEYFSMTAYQSGLMMMHNWNGLVLLLHYLSLALVLILGQLITTRVYWYQKKTTQVLRALDLVIVLFILFILCTEYDNVTVMLSVLQKVPGTQAIVEGDLLSYNKFLPYSLITWILSVVVLVRAIAKRNSFLRNFAIILFTIMLVKLFAFDFEQLSEGARSVMFLALGLFMIGFAFVYPRLLKGQPILPEIKRKNEE